MNRSIVPLSDKALVAKVRTGDYRAFELLVRRHEKKIYNLAFRMLGNREDAGDILQEAFLQAFRKLDTFKDEAEFSTWIYRIAVNLCLMKKRKEKGHRVISLEAPVLYQRQKELKTAIADDWSKEPSANLENKELKQMLKEAIKELPAEYRAVFLLREAQELSNEEAAKVLKISLAAVKSRLHRARLFLRDKLAHYFKEYSTLIKRH